MITSVSQRLRAISIPEPRAAYHQEAVTTFFRLLYVLSRGQVVEHPAIVSLTHEAFEQIIQQPRLPLCLGGVHTMRVVRPAAPLPPVPIIFLPGSFLHAVRADPLDMLGRMVALSCQYLDLLQPDEPEAFALEQRASAYEAHLLLGLRAAYAEVELAFSPTKRQQRLLQRFPHGLASLPHDLASFSWLRPLPAACL